MLRGRSDRRHGFSIIDLLVVIAVLGFLLGVILAALPRVHQAAADTQCQNNLKQLALALHNCNDTYRKMPPCVGPFPGNDPAKQYGTLHYYLLPFVEQDNLYKLTLDNQGNGFVWNRRVNATPVPLFQCPSDPAPPPNHVYKGALATTNYAANWLAFGQGGARIPASFPDGTSNTIVFAERYQVCKDTPCAWGYAGVYYWAPLFARYSEAKFQQRPTAAACDPALPQGFHPGGIAVALADGSTRHVAPAISTQTWWFACTPNGGEVLGDDWE